MIDLATAMLILLGIIVLGICFRILGNIIADATEKNQ